ncbi:Nn.00g005180.m01.CDS01 [Neocucurbitaria sp. VM-36]
MARSSEAHTTHTLDFFYDDEDSCALTVLVNDVRFHIIVGAKDLQKSREKPLYYEYLDKISALREAEQREEERTEKAQAQAKTSDNKHKGREGSNDKDSGVDMAADDEEDGEDEDQDSGSAGVELRNWILSAFADVTAKWAPPDREPEESTLYDWYHGPTYFYGLQIQSGKLSPELLETTDELNQRIEKIVPRMKLPKYICNMDIPWLDAKDLTVQSEISIPEPAHPGRVIHNETGDTYFFKPVDASQPGPTKREIQILQRLANLDLDIKVPKILGFVSFENSKTEAMGILLSNIDFPTPLTKLLQSSVPASKRSAWRQKSQEYISLLHKHDIIWGDAKADNFMVDANDELWIIDFGGSYTEGWVDPELSETKEGDKMGLEKIQNALEDPDKNTFDPIGSAEVGARETASSLFVTERKDKGHKRKRNEDEDGENKRKRGDA